MKTKLTKLNPLQRLLLYYNMKLFKLNKILLLALSPLFIIGCASSNKVSMEVVATAYNSVESQTKKNNPSLAAWGDILEPGERAIAVSRDLIKMGLDHNQKVKIEGLPGVYIVKDKMNKRWTKKIDIYMGLNEKAAKEWGKQNVVITFNRKE